MDERLNGTWETKEEDKELQERFWLLFGPNKIKSPNLRIGAEFLRKNKDLLQWIIFFDLMTKNILIVGADGLIGSSLFSELESSRYNIFGTTKRLGSNFPYLEITDNEKDWPEFDENDFYKIVEYYEKYKKI